MISKGEIEKGYTATKFDFKGKLNGNYRFCVSLWFLSRGNGQVLYSGPFSVIIHPDLSGKLRMTTVTCSLA